MTLILTAQWWRRVCPQPQPSSTEKWDIRGLVGTRFKGLLMVRGLVVMGWGPVEVIMFATLW